MAELPPLPCPTCGTPLGWSDDAIHGPLRSATSYDTCLRRCDEHGIGWSNGRSNPTRIYRDPLDNVPAEVRAGAAAALAAALNERNRPSKLAKFAFETSEDAVTWTVFRALQDAGQLDLIRRLALGAPSRRDQREALLFWGVPVPADDPIAGDTRDRLVAISDRLGETPASRSEPDVVLDFGDGGVVFVEVKHRSGNDLQDEAHPGWEKYVGGSDAFRGAVAARASRHYELARNWRFAWELANDRPMALVNLGPGQLFQGEAGLALAGFEETLTQADDRRFVRLTWPALLEGFVGAPAWLTHFAEERRLHGASERGTR